MRQQAHGNPAANHVGPDLQNFMLAIQERHIDRKLHREGVDPLARHDPQTLAGRETGVFQQARTAFRTGIGDLGAVGQHAAACQIGYAELRQNPGYRTRGGTIKTWTRSSARPPSAPVAFGAWRLRFAASQVCNRRRWATWSAP